MTRCVESDAEAVLATEAGQAIDLSVVDRIVEEIGNGRASAIPILQAIQSHFRYLPTESLQRVCQISRITPAQIEGVATFYSQFRRLPVGQHLISVCHGTACHVAGAEVITDSVRRYLGIEADRDTDPQRVFTVQKVACLGCCWLAPVMRIDSRTYGHLTWETAPRAVERFLRERTSRRRGRHRWGRRWRRAPARDQQPVQIRIGLGSCCMASGSMAVKDAIEAEIPGLGAGAVVKCGGCVGMCHRVPLVEFIGPDGGRARYGNVTPEAISSIVQAYVRPVGIVGKARALFGRATDLLFKDSAWESAEKYAIDRKNDPSGPFLAKQKHIVLEGCGQMDPLDIDEYVAHGGYGALQRCLRTMGPDEIIPLIEKSGLRGRGGAGFPTGDKWALVRRQPGPKKYVVMNGDEGDPGAFMDRMLLESYPHRVLEGMTIAAQAVGADEGYLYIRAEYPLALQRVREAIRDAEARGYLGDRILGTDFGLRLHVVEGAGAFVCGEETGLIASIEGRRGTPRLRPPYPAEAGLWGRPTNISNVETYATVPWIIRHGPEAFAATGTAGSKGTKVFALTGKVDRGGLIEVPMGITIGEIVREIGGGVRKGRRFKAVQVGGPSGGCIPAALHQTRIDYEELTEAGAMMGSGGLVVMDETTCMVDIARFFLQFTQNESCGQCTFCRIGTKRMLEILERICAGRGKRSDLKKLEELADGVRRTSLCGLGRTAPNPVLTTLRYFREEYESHIEGRCPAKTCRALITYRITDECTGCTLCAQHCRVGAIEIRPYEKHEIDTEKCVRCGACLSVCPSEAVEVQ